MSVFIHIGEAIGIPVHFAQYSSQLIAVEMLLDPTTQHNFLLKLHNRFALLSESDESASSIENLWKEGRDMF